MWGIDNGLYSCLVFLCFDYLYDKTRFYPQITLLFSFLSFPFFSLFFCIYLLHACTGHVCHNPYVGAAYCWWESVLSSLHKVRLSSRYVFWVSHLPDLTLKKLYPSSDAGLITKLKLTVLCMVAFLCSFLLQSCLISLTDVEFVYYKVFGFLWIFRACSLRSVAGVWTGHRSWWIPPSPSFPVSHFPVFFFFIRCYILSYHRK